VVDELEAKWLDAMNGYNQDDGRNHPASVFDTHMDLLTLALFVWDMPTRKEKFELQFVLKPQKWKPTEAGNFVNLSSKTERVIIHYNTEKKKHQPIHFELQFGSGKSVIDTYNKRLSDLYAVLISYTNANLYLYLKIHGSLTGTYRITNIASCVLNTEYVAEEVRQEPSD
jgi:hypothetical protein